MKIFNNPSGVLLKRSLDILMRHNQNISENVANLNNPDYQRKATRFLDELSTAQRRTGLQVTKSRHIRPDPYESQIPEWEQGPVTPSHLDRRLGSVHPSYGVPRGTSRR